MFIRLLLAVVFLVVVVGGIVGFNMFRDNMIETIFAEMQPPAVSVTVVEAEAGEWRPSIEAIGTARAVQGVEVAVEAGGVVREVLFAANDRVEQGQRLLQIDDAIERADLEAAQATLDLAEETLQRLQTLQTRGVSATTNVDAARTEATAARAQVIRLQALLDQKALVAPFAGVTGIPRVDPGQYVTVGTLYATLQDLERMRVDFTIPEQQLPLIGGGTPVSVTVETTGEVLNGQVTAIEPQVDAATRLVTLRAEVENADGALNPGNFVRVRIELPGEEGVVSLPQSAVSSTLYGDMIYVVRGENEDELTVEQVFVRIGRREGGRIEITQGLEAGERVVSVGQNRLTGGARVAIAQTAAAAAPVTE